MQKKVSTKIGVLRLPLKHCDEASDYRSMSKTSPALDPILFHVLEMGGDVEGPLVNGGEVARVDIIQSDARSWELGKTVQALITTCGDLKDRNFLVSN